MSFISRTLLTKTPRYIQLNTKPTLTILSQRQAPLSTSPNLKMPQDLKASEVNAQTDPSVAKQYDHDTPMHQQFSEFYDMAGKLKIAMLTTQRPDVGMVSRSMAVAKRSGPDFLFLANNHSRKFEDLNANKQVQVTFQNSTGNQDWASVSGTATTVSNNDPRIGELWNKSTKAWFGDLGDGKHDGSADDPRMSLIEGTT